MTGELVFMMGQFAARIPTDRQYARNHMWAQAAGGKFRFGFTAYAVRLLQDVYFLDWSIDAGTMVREKQAIGSIESSKAESELYAPMMGRLTEFNAGLLADPSAINVDNYTEGWLFEMEGGGESLLSGPEYVVHLEAAWAVAERTIKGQMNE
ncbi:MAG: glycine cleavage system protein H [Pirellulales bacterium]